MAGFWFCVHHLALGRRRRSARPRRHCRFCWRSRFHAGAVVGLGPANTGQGLARAIRPWWVRLAAASASSTAIEFSLVDHTGWPPCVGRFGPCGSSIGSGMVGGRCPARRACFMPPPQDERQADRCGGPGLAVEDGRHKAGTVWKKREGARRRAALRPRQQARQRRVWPVGPGPRA